MENNDYIPIEELTIPKKVESKPLPVEKPIIPMTPEKKEVEVQKFNENPVTKANNLMLVDKSVFTKFWVFAGLLIIVLFAFGIWFNLNFSELASKESIDNTPVTNNFQMNNTINPPSQNINVNPQTNATIVVNIQANLTIPNANFKFYGNST